MRNRLYSYLIFIILIYSLKNSICNAEQETEDVFASVIVLSAFDINIDNNYLHFGQVEPGESVTLKEGAYYNEIKCISNKGFTYYIKIHILDEIIGPTGSKIPASSFKWRVLTADGSGTVISEWQEFSHGPALVYTSGAEDEIGNEVTIRFQYRLDLPPQAMGGHYSLRVAYMLTEEE